MLGFFLIIHWKLKTKATSTALYSFDSRNRKSSKGEIDRKIVNSIYIYKISVYILFGNEQKHLSRPSIDPNRQKTLRNIIRISLEVQQFDVCYKIKDMNKEQIDISLIGNYLCREFFHLKTCHANVENVYACCHVKHIYSTFSQSDY